jgi:hypothetical protein
MIKPSVQLQIRWLRLIPGWKYVSRSGSHHVGQGLALTRKQYSAKLLIDRKLLSQVREHFQSVENEFKAATGYGFDALTESEARDQAKHNDAHSVRNRIIAAGSTASLGANEGNARFSKDARPYRLSVNSANASFTNSRGGSASWQE